tara:strand:- start:94 stop:204 length:111 start_codon:yes stop_codon:yes gene_type:complete
MASLKKRHKKTPLCDSGIFYGASMALLWRFAAALFT